MVVMQWMLQWVHIMGLYLLIEGICIGKEKKTPFRIKSLEALEQKEWRKWRVFGNFSWGIGLYVHHAVENVVFSAGLHFLLFTIGIVLSFLGLFLIIRNNIKHINSWTSTV